MGLADAVKAAPVKRAEAVPLDEALADALDTVKLLLSGGTGTGKTTFLLSVLAYLKEKGLSPSQVRMLFVDNDAGLMPLLRKGALEKDWMKSVLYSPCANFKDIDANTRRWLPELQKHQKENGTDSAWLVVDNTKSEWEWVREHYALQAYGMHEYELAVQKRQEAKARGVKMLPTFDQRIDYGVINPIHRAWADDIKLSGLNFIFTCPESSWKDKDEDGNETLNVKPSCQKDDVFRVNEHVRLYLDGGERYMSLEKSRNILSEKLPGKISRPSFSRLVEVLKKVGGQA